MKNIVDKVVKKGEKKDRLFHIRIPQNPIEAFGANIWLIVA